MSKYILYGGGLTLGAAVQMVLDYLDIPYQLESVDILKNEQKQVAYRELNPAGFLPALVIDDEIVLHETAAMMLYLADHYDCGGLSVDPQSPMRGVFLSRLWYLTNEVQTLQKIYFYPHRYSSKACDADRIQAQARQQALARWQVINSVYLDEGRYLIGEHPTIADLLMCVLASYGMQGESDVLSQYSRVNHVYQRISKTPCWGERLVGLNQGIVAFSEKRDRVENLSNNHD